MINQAASNYLKLRKTIPSTIELVVATKDVSWSNIQPLYDAGCRHFGESYVQEALDKIEQAPKDVKWHFIGNLQKNKVRKVVGKFVLIHSVDSLELAEKISESSQGSNTSILLEVNTSGEITKHGFKPKECQEVFEQILNLPHIEVQGFMAMAPYMAAEAIIRKAFADLRQLRDQLAKQYEKSLPVLSMGMSSDYGYAISEGATLLRIGTSIFG